LGGGAGFGGSAPGRLARGGLLSAAIVAQPAATAESREPGRTDSQKNPVVRVWTCSCDHRGKSIDGVRWRCMGEFEGNRFILNMDLREE